MPPLSHGKFTYVLHIVKMEHRCHKISTNSQNAPIRKSRQHWRPIRSIGTTSIVNWMQQRPSTSLPSQGPALSFEGPITGIWTLQLHLSARLLIRSLIWSTALAFAIHLFCLIFVAFLALKTQESYCTFLMLLQSLLPKKRRRRRRSSCQKFKVI